MTTMLKRLVEEQNTVWQRMQDITAAAEKEGRDWTAEERTNYDAAEARLDEVSGDIERLERKAKLEKIDREHEVIPTSGKDDDTEGRGGDDTVKRYAETFELFLRSGADELDPDQKRLLRTGFSKIDRAQGTVPGTAGGYLVPEGFRNTMTETMKAFGGLIGLATVINTDTGQDLPWPTNDDTGNEGALLSQNTQVTEQDVDFGERELKAYTFTSKLVRVAIQLLQDGAFSLDSWLPMKLGERIGRAVAGYLCTGTGIDQPEGITTNLTVGKQGTTGQTTSIIYDDLIDLEHSVDPAYRTRAEYLMHDQMLKVIRKLKDGDGRPLWVPVPAPGFPATINGFSYAIDNKMPTPAADAKTIVFGDIKAGYIVRQVRGVQVMRLTERYADYLQVGFLGFSRVDGMPDDTAAIRAYQHSAS